jgi:linoleoyl-CoA desaturase
LLGAFLFGIFHSHLGITISHDGCHGSYSKNKTITRLAASMMDLMGGSRLVWFMQHNIGHHPNCNRQGTTSQAEDYDPDVRSGTPIMRFNEAQPWKPYHSYQHIYIWLLFAGVGVKWYINDIKAIFREKYLTFDFFEITQEDRRLLIITKSMFVIYSFIVPIYLHGIVRGLALMLLFWSVTSYMFALNFAVNHLTEDNHFPREKDQPIRDWAKLQVLTTSNFGTSNPVCSWITGGLNYQIEHHLFPGMNHVYLAQIAPIVKQTCKEYGLKYTDYPTYWDAVVAYHNHVRNLGTGPVPKKKVL